MKIQKMVFGFCKKALIVSLTGLMALGSFSGAFLFPEIPVANAQVTGVTVADNDTAGFGVDGRDFTINWTPGESAPAGYVGTRVYLFSNFPDGGYTASNVTLNGCGGNPCQELAFFTQYEQALVTLPEFIKTDSEGNNFPGLDSYHACVLVSATESEFVCSSDDPGFTPTSDTPDDTNAPFIDHMPAHSASAGVDAVLHAFVFDDQTTIAEFANTGDGGVEFFQLVYSADGFETEGTTVNAVNVSGNLFKFTIASGNVPVAGQTLQYYLTARDNVADPVNQSFFCADWTAGSAANCQAAPFVINIGEAGSRTIAGTISSGGVGLGGAAVFAGGYASAGVTTAGGGTYTLTGLPDNSAFDITASKIGYCQQMRFETIGAQNLTGVNMNLNLGDCNFSAGGEGGGSGGAPQVMFSGPWENAFGVPTTEKMRVGMNQTMNSSTINDLNAADAGSNVYLTTDDGTTKIAGQALYCESASSPGCSFLPPGDGNVILFNPTNALTENTFYALVITEAVTSSSGQSIQGNRSGGGHKIPFTTGGAGFTMDETFMTNNYGQGGQYMPPYVRSMSPGPGMQSPVGVSMVLEFSERMSSATISPTNIQLWNISTGLQVTLLAGEITLEPNEQRLVTINPGSNLAAGEYEMRVKGGAASSSGISFMPPDQAGSTAFVSNFTISSSVVAVAPTVYPMVASGSSIAVNEGVLEFGFSEPLLPSSVSTTNVTVKRGTTNVSGSVKYDSGSNSVRVIPSNVLAPNTSYTVTFTASGITSTGGVALASAASYTYTTGDADTVAPKVVNARCDDNTCAIFFSEPINAHTQADANYSTSVLNPANVTVTITPAGSDPGPATELGAIGNIVLSYSAQERKLTIKGLVNSEVALAGGSGFVLTVNSGVTDLSSNAIGGTNNTWSGTAESSANTFGSFGDTGMFGPPMQGGAGTEFKAEGFGSFSSEQFAFGQADMAFPFNSMAGQDVNVFQTRFSPGVALQNDDKVVLTFPNGTGIASAVPDTFSPFYTDMNEWGAGTVAFDTDFSTDGVGVDTTSRQVTVQLAVTGTPGANDTYTIDLRSITNPSVPKGPDTGGYTVDIKVMRAGVSVVNKTSMPYFIMAGGSRSITVNIKAGNAETPDNVAGNVFLWGGGPSGPLDKQITMAAGSGTVTYSSLPDGCYFFGTEPMITLGGTDYFGQQSPDSTCVNSENTSRTRTIVLGSSGGSASVPVTVKLEGIADFGGVDIDIFAGGPGSFVVKTLSAVGVPEAEGYTIRLPQNGNWFMGVGPAMPKGNTTGKKMGAQLPGNPPPPIDIGVAGVGTDTATISAGRFTPPGVSVDTASKTVTFTFASADKQVTGVVKDGSGNALQNVEVFMHSTGFGGSPAFTTTNSTGAFTLNISELGSYEIGAFKDGLPPRFSSIEILSNDSVAAGDGNSTADVVYKGKQITGANPLVLTLNKADYTISGKVLDANSNAISYAPVSATDTQGNFVGGGTDSNGNYTLFVAAGTWTVRSELPPDKTDECGTFSKTVTVTTESKSSQNITPTAGACYEISGTVTIGGSASANAPLFVEEWDTVNDRPSASGLHRGTSTNESGEYTVKVSGSKTYRVGTWDPNTGEISTTVAVASSNATGDITATTGAITFAFTGGTADMNAFVEVKKSNDSMTRLGKQKNGLNSNLEVNVSSGTYSYFVDVFGIGKFTGTVATGATATIDLSGSTQVTLGGTVYDSLGAALSGVLVSAKETTTGIMTTALTSSLGVYSMKVKTGTYTVSASRAGYMPGQVAANVTLTANNTAYNFGGNSAVQQAMTKAGTVISGTVYKTGGSSAVSEGFVTATNTITNIVVSAAVESNGTYSLPVNDGTWTVAAKAPRHSKTAFSSNVVVGGSDATSKNITLTVDATKESKSASSVVAAASGGSVNDTGNSGIKMTAGKGVLQSSAGNVTVSASKSFTAPETTNFTPLGDASFNITAEGTSSIKTLNGNADIEIDYTDLLSDLPAGINESDLQLAYYSPERGEYIPVEGGFSVDTVNNKVTAQTNHFTSFMVVYGAAGQDGGGDDGGGQESTPPTGGGGSTVVAQIETTPAEETSATEETPATPPTVASLRVQIATLQATLLQLISQMIALTGVTPNIPAGLLPQVAGVPTGFAFGTNLSMRATGQDVKNLQIMLNKSVDTQIASTGPGSPGNETTYFGSLTEVAVIKFQQKYASEVLTPAGLSSGTGFVGSSTRAKLNALLGQ